jgi:monosaccharide-transporting ATPase
VPRSRRRSSPKRTWPISWSGEPCPPFTGAPAVDLDVERGEIVGITGRAGSGYEVLPYLLGGAVPAVGGSLAIDGDAVDLARATVRELLVAGVVLVPERRELHGLAFGLPVAENLTLPHLRRRGRRWFSGLRWQREEAERIVRSLDVRPSDPTIPVGKLSGGNQQKVLLARWLLTEPRLLILDEPTRGIDVGAKTEVQRLVRSLVDDGVAVLFVSAELEEVLRLSDRIDVLRDRRLIAELVNREGVTVDTIVHTIADTEVAV